MLAGYKLIIMEKLIMNETQFIKSVWIIFFLLFSLSSCADSFQDEHVYRVAVQGYCDKKNKGYSILQSTSTHLPEREKISSSGPDILNVEAVDDAYNRNRVVTDLPASIACDQLKILSETVIIEGFKTKPKLPYNPVVLEEDWAGFFEKFSGVSSIVEISVPGYSKDGKYAVIYLQSVCGSVCGGGSFIQYKKINGKWVYDKRDNIWIS
jgi:hypothetical protein